MNTETFTYDLFLSHSAKDKAVVRPLAERLRADGLTSNAKGRSLKAKVELQPSAFCLQPCPRAFGSDWAQLEAGTFRFRDPLNRERRFMPTLQPSAFILQPLPDASIKGSLAQFLYINWRPADREQQGLKARKKLVQRKRSAMSAAPDEPRTT